MNRVRPQNLPGGASDSEEEEEDELASPQPPKKKSRKVRKTPPGKQLTWDKEDISYPPLPPYNHPAPECVRSPFEYFQDMFTLALLEEIVYETNLYARQKDVTTSFNTDVHEMMVFIGIICYMGITLQPSIEDYWATMTRVPQVADVMPSKRFKLLRAMLHFNNNETAHTSTDRFFKVRPLFNSITRQFKMIPETPTQSIDEVMVAYKGTRAGSLRQFVQNKPDRWGYKLLCRASIDGIIHDIVLYQGETTFSSHPTPLSEEESEYLVSTKTVIALAKTLKKPKQTAIYADNWFTSIGLVQYLRDSYGCRYVGTARTNRIGSPPLMEVKEMEKKAVPRGKHDMCSADGILALRWKDNKVVTVLSSDAGVEPMTKVTRYDRQVKKQVEVPCPNVIHQYNGKMGGIDKSDMLVHLYKTPMKARRWYMRLFGYVLDVCISNAWLLYKRDCASLKERAMPLKNFRLDISRYARCQKSMTPRSTRLSLHREPMPIPKRGQKTAMPDESQRYEGKEWHMPINVTTRQTCKHCSRKEQVHRTRWMCTVCKIALCLSDVRNCFIDFHSDVRSPPHSRQSTPSPSS